MDIKKCHYRKSEKKLRIAEATTTTKIARFRSRRKLFLNISRQKGETNNNGTQVRRFFKKTA